MKQDADDNLSEELLDSQLKFNIFQLAVKISGHLSAIN